MIDLTVSMRRMTESVSLIGRGWRGGAAYPSSWRLYGWVNLTWSLTCYRQSTNDLQNGDSLMELNLDLGRILDPGLPVTLHWGPSK